MHTKIMYKRISNAFQAPQTWGQVAMPAQMPTCPAPRLQRLLLTQYSLMRQDMRRRWGCVWSRHQRAA
jgi:hypothetical protein